jgi:hypothetical protein
VAQAGAQPFAALLDAAVSPAPDSGAGASAASAQPSQQRPAADTGAGAQDDAAASAPAPSAGKAAQEPAAPGNNAPTQSANAGLTDSTGDRKSAPAPDGNDATNLVAIASANGMAIQIANAQDTHQPTAMNGAGRKPGPAPNLNLPAIMMPAPQASANGTPNASNGTGVNPNGTTPAASDPAVADAADAGQSASKDTAAALVAAVLADLKGAVSADGVTPGAAKLSADGKDDQKDQENGPADSATALPAPAQAQLLSPALAQPVAAAVAVNAAPDSVPAAAKPGLAVADAVKARTKVMLSPAATAQTAPADDNTDAPGSRSAIDAGGSNDSAASSGSGDPTGNALAASAQQTTDQVQAPGAGGLGLLSQIDFAALGGTEHFGLRGEAASSNATTGWAAPNGIANAATAPSFGIFGLNPIATNMAAPAAAASEPAVPLAGLAVAIAGRAQAGSSQFDIRLDPPELGRIDVRLDVDGSGQVRTHVTVDRPDTLQLLQSQQPQLERALEQAGLKTADNGLQFTLRDQSFAGQNSGTGGQHYPNQPAAPVVIPDIDAVPIDTAQIYARLRLGNGLDISV